jgi:hypothetical protein
MATLVEQTSLLRVAEHEALAIEVAALLRELAL